jgi:hypothetical protein
MNKIKIDISLSLSSDMDGNPLFLDNSENSQDSRHVLLTPCNNHVNKPRPLSC